MSVESIFPDVAEILADVLILEVSDIELNKRLIGDLNAESIDFLDIMFQFERKFDVKIPRDQIVSDVRQMMGEGEFEEEGVLTPKGLDALKSYLSEVPDEHFKENMKVGEIPSLFTVETLCKLILKIQGMTETNKSKETETTS